MVVVVVVVVVVLLLLLRGGRRLLRMGIAEEGRVVPAKTRTREEAVGGG